MTASWEQFEELIKAEMRKVYSETAIDHFMNPRNAGDMGKGLPQTLRRRIDDATYSFSHR